MCRKKNTTEKLNLNFIYIKRITVQEQNLSSQSAKCLIQFKWLQNQRQQVKGVKKSI